MVPTKEIVKNTEKKIERNKKKMGRREIEENYISTIIPAEKKRIKQMV